MNKASKIAITMLVALVGFLGYQNTKAPKQAGGRIGHPNTFHPDQVEGQGALVINPAVIRDVDCELQIRGSYVVTTASWNQLD